MIHRHAKLVILVLTTVLSCQVTGTAANHGILVAQGVPDNESDGLALDVNPTKLMYAKNEPIELNVRLRNAGQRSQIVARRLSLGMRIKLIVLDPNGNSAKGCGRIADEIVILRDNYKLLSQGESVGAKLTISCHSSTDPNREGYFFDRPGKYVVKVAYQLVIPKENYERAFPNAHVIRGPVWAKPITIEIAQ